MTEEALILHDSSYSYNLLLLLRNGGVKGLTSVSVVVRRSNSHDVVGLDDGGRNKAVEAIGSRTE